MKKKKLRLVAVFVVLAVLLSVPASALESRASAYIDSYFMDVLSAGSGVLGIEFLIEGTGRMTAIGAETITVYKANGWNWDFVTEFNRNDNGMIDTNAICHGNTIYFYGTAGVRYKVTVTLFSENANGYDSRTENFILIA